MKQKRTVVLMWNPRISSVKEADYTEWFEGMCTFSEEVFNWSVWDYKHTGYGDRFVLVRVGDEKAGLVMDGMVASDCYEGSDWAGSDRKRYYADLVPMTAYNPASGAIYPLQHELQEAVPDFDWSGGHSGRVLTARQTRSLDEFIGRFKDSDKEQAADITKIRIRDYLASPSLIHPTMGERRKCPTEDPRPFIEALIKQSTGIAADQLEAKWEKHRYMWVRRHEGLLRAAAWIAFPHRARLPYYGALCLKLALQDLGDDSKINAAYAKEAADYLIDPKLKNEAINMWLGESLRSHQDNGRGYAVSPMIRDKVAGLDILSDFIGCDALAAESILHDYFLAGVEINSENDYINIDVSYGHDDEEEEEEILRFHIVGDIGFEGDCKFASYSYISEARISPWREDGVQLRIDGYGLRAHGTGIEISIRKAGMKHSENCSSEATRQ